MILEMKPAKKLFHSAEASMSRSSDGVSLGWKSEGISLTGSHGFQSTDGLMAP